MDDIAMANGNAEKKTEQSKIYVKKRLLYIFHEDDVKVFDLSGKQQFGRLTKNNVPELYSDARTVSRRHGLFMTSEDIILYMDVGSSNGTTVNDHALEPMKPEKVGDGSVLRIHALNNQDSIHDIVMVVTTDNPDDTGWAHLPLEADIKKLEVGRGKDISLRGRTASRNHASFVRAVNGWAIVDNNSLNGVYLNGQRIVEPVLLRPMDVIRIAKHLFVFRGDHLFFQEDKAPSLQNKWENMPPEKRRARSLPGEIEEKQPSAPVQQEQQPAAPVQQEKQPSAPVQQEKQPAAPVQQEKQPSAPVQQEQQPAAPVQQEKSAREKGKLWNSGAGKVLSVNIKERIVWNRLRKKAILRDINLRVESGSLVLILGGSGAGKTTFMNAVMGYEPARGKIVYGSSDIYREFEKMKYEIGYVPQQDLLRMEDVVYDTLENAARMRLPDTMSDLQREQRVQYTLNMFGLIREKDSLVGKLSGGQRKRLSIAVEYIGNPSLFFLDEPDSGLDGIMARDLMMNLRQIADQNKIVMVISHSPDRAFELFDKIVVLAKSGKDDCGHLIFYGTPDETRRFFGTETLEQVVGRVNRKDEGGEGLADYYLQKFQQLRGVPRGE